MSAAEDINNDINKCYFLVVPHSAYYSCFLLMEHLCYKVFAVNNKNEIKSCCRSEKNFLICGSFLHYKGDTASIYVPL